MIGPVLAALTFIAAIGLVRVTVALGLVEPARWMPLALEVGAAAVPIALVIGLLHARLLAVNDLVTENEGLRAELRSLQARRQRRQQPVPTPVVAAGLEQLSRREREVLTLVAEGWSNQAISDHLVLSLKTVESHVRSVFIKLGLEPDEATHRRVLAARAQMGIGDGARRPAWTTNVEPMASAAPGRGPATPTPTSRRANRTRAGGTADGRCPRSAHRHPRRR